MSEFRYVARAALVPFHERTQRWAVLVTHRRLGKTTALVNDLGLAMLDPPPGVPEPRYAFVAPFRAQAHDIAWSMVESALGALPGAELNRSDLRVTLHNGASLTLYGDENAERLRGIGLCGLACDEFASWRSLDTWRYILRPTLVDHKGWAVFAGTPKREVQASVKDASAINPLRVVWEKAQGDPRWFRLMAPASATGVIPADELVALKDEIGEVAFAQEFECEFRGLVEGSYYGLLVAALEKADKLGLPYLPDPNLPIQTAWDLGMDDSTAIWAFQVHPATRQLKLLGYYENRGQGLSHYWGILRQRYTTKLGTCWLPPDGRVRELGTGASRAETLASMGADARIVPGLRLHDGIEAVRWLLGSGRVAFCKPCVEGVEALRCYRAGPNGPIHDEASHGADAFRYLAIVVRPQLGYTTPVHKVVDLRPKADAAFILDTPQDTPDDGHAWRL